MKTAHLVHLYEYILLSILIWVVHHAPRLCLCAAILICISPFFSDSDSSEMFVGRLGLITEFIGHKCNFRYFDFSVDLYGGHIWTRRGFAAPRLNAGASHSVILVYVSPSMCLPETARWCFLPHKRYDNYDMTEYDWLSRNSPVPIVIIKTFCQSTSPYNAHTLLSQNVGVTKLAEGVCGV